MRSSTDCTCCTHDYRTYFPNSLSTRRAGLSRVASLTLLTLLAVSEAGDQVLCVTTRPCAAQGHTRTGHRHAHPCMPLHTHCAPTAHPLRTHCTSTSHALHIRCTHTAHTLHTHCTHAAYAPQAISDLSVFVVLLLVILLGFVFMALHISLYSPRWLGSRYSL